MRRKIQEFWVDKNQISNDENEKKEIVGWKERKRGIFSLIPTKEGDDRFHTGQQK